jgi:hypothetical protein
MTIHRRPPQTLSLIDAEWIWEVVYAINVQHQGGSFYDSRQKGDLPKLGYRTTHASGLSAYILASNACPIHGISSCVIGKGFPAATLVSALL